jgi:hypothetical protein
MTGMWHLPYLSFHGYVGGKGFYKTGDEVVVEEDAIKISASLCAQVSYRKSDESLDKALKIYDQLVTMKPVHASPFEHQATPIFDPTITGCGMVFEALDEDGVTHMDREGQLWSGNFKGWIQNRQLIPNHVFNG